MIVTVDNGQRALIPGLASNAGVRIRDDVAIVSVRNGHLEQPPMEPGTTVPFCDADWTLADPAPSARDDQTCTFTFNRSTQ